MREEWNPRYLAYCQATGGLGPRETWERDGERYPGGRGAGFLLWVSARLQEWRKEVKHSGGMLSQHHEAFDAWLAAREAPADSQGQILLALEAA